MILLLDNFDSFTYNLFHYVEQITDQPVDVKRNNEIALDEIEKYDSVILSPGPGLPSETPLLTELIQTYGSQKPILGVCLGLQAIGEAYGAQLENLSTVQHGVERNVHVVIPDDRLFSNIPKTFVSGRYHSWVVDSKNLPQELHVTAVDDNNFIMALSHYEHPVSGIQFHPESVMTPEGMKILKNWIAFCTKYNG